MERERHQNAAERPCQEIADHGETDHHADPAISSGVFVTTVTDVVGFFSFLGIATLWFGLK